LICRLSGCVIQDWDGPAQPVLATEIAEEGTAHAHMSILMRQWVPQSAPTTAARACPTPQSEHSTRAN